MSDTSSLAIRPRSIEVRSRRNPMTLHTVTLPHCTCEGFTQRSTCAHVVSALTTCLGWTAIPLAGDIAAQPAGRRADTA